MMGSIRATIDRFHRSHRTTDLGEAQVCVVRRARRVRLPARVRDDVAEYHDRLAVALPRARRRDLDGVAAVCRLGEGTYDR